MTTKIERRQHPWYKLYKDILFNTRLHILEKEIKGTVKFTKRLLLGVHRYN